MQIPLRFICTGYLQRSGTAKVAGPREAKLCLSGEEIDHGAGETEFFRLCLPEEKGKIEPAS